MSLIRRYFWNEQPQDEGQLADGVKLAVTPFQSRDVTPNANVTRSANKLGQSWLFDSNGDYITSNGGALVRENFGILFVAQLVGGPSNGQTLFQLLETGGGLANRTEIYCATAGFVRVDMFYGDGSANAWTVDTNSGVLADGVPFVVYLESKGGTLTMFLNGVRGGSATITPNTASSATYTIGGRSNNTQGFPGHIYLHAVVDPRYFVGEQISLNPWQVFSARETRLLIGAAAGYVFNPMSGRGGAAAQPVIH